jgi:hypothetical protein
MDGGLPASAARAQGARFPYLPCEQHAKLTASAGVTAVTGCSWLTYSFFGQRTIHFLSKKLVWVSTHAGRIIGSQNDCKVLLAFTAAS